MARQYLGKAGTSRWHVAVFYIMACTNAFVLYKKRMGRGGSVSKREYIFRLATELIEDYLAEGRARRSASKQESSRTRKKSLKRKQCQVAVNCKQNKTMKSCHKCDNLV